jgi:hypothetical protein
MRRLNIVLCILLSAACGPEHSGFGPDGEAPKDGGGIDGDNDSPYTPIDSGDKFGDSSSDAPIGDGGTVSTVYANTDTTLYTLDPQTNAVTLVGNFVGVSDASNDSTITDVAVNSAGDVYVNSESVIYKATVPQTPGPVMLTKIASIALQTGQKFYALAFAPAGSLASTEVLIGGDINGELWAIDTTNGNTKDLGSFGTDPGHTGYDFALSGDLVFYNDAKNNPTGLATVRPCKPKSTSCITSSDYLMAVDMTALANAYKTTAGASLNKGIYGGSSTSDGAGTGYGDLFGLGAWEGTVFAFARKTGSNATPLLLTINTTTGAGTVVSSAFSFTNGWSGAGVTTSVTVTVPPPN